MFLFYVIRYYELQSASFASIRDLYLEFRIANSLTFSRNLFPMYWFDSYSEDLTQINLKSKQRKQNYVKQTPQKQNKPNRIQTNPLETVPTLRTFLWQVYSTLSTTQRQLP